MNYCAKLSILHVSGGPDYASTFELIFKFLIFGIMMVTLEFGGLRKPGKKAGVENFLNQERAIKFN